VTYGKAGRITSRRYARSETCRARETTGSDAQSRQASPAVHAVRAVPPAHRGGPVPSKRASPASRRLVPPRCARRVALLCLFITVVIAKRRG
jgi:hypothetical protein